MEVSASPRVAMVRLLSHLKPQSFYILPKILGKESIDKVRITRRTDLSTYIVTKDVCKEEILQ